MADEQIFLSYYRVSTDKQGKEGFGIDAQKAAVARHVGNRKILAEYTEVESGRKNERPEMMKALKHARMTGATLVIAKLDRLSRNAHFISELMEAKVNFVACDLPAADQMTIRVLAAVAQQEAESTSRRTKEALAAAKARGVKLGSPQNATAEGRRKGARIAAARRSQKQSAFRAEIEEVLRDMRGDSLERIPRQEMADRLNIMGLKTARGIPWTPQAVSSLKLKQRKSRLVRGSDKPKESLYTPPPLR